MIRFAEVVVRYPGAATAAVQGVSFEAAPGRSVFGRSAFIKLEWRM